jgi:two-component system copper resistance phosphate regulon response regulator CusR
MAAPYIAIFNERRAGSKSANEDTLSRSTLGQWGARPRILGCHEVQSAHFLLVRLLYGRARPTVRILLIDDVGPTAVPHLSSGAGLYVTVVSSPGDRLVEDISLFESIVLAVHEPLEERVECCRLLREKGYVGAVLAVCGEVAEGEALLDAGADDFVTAPFETRELVARIRACVRRAAAHSRFQWGPLELDRVQRVVRLRGRSVALTARECGLLVCLIEAGGRSVSRADLRARVWPGKRDKGSNLIEVYLSRLRDKLGEDAAMIETVRRAGYRLRR